MVKPIGAFLQFPTAKGSKRAFPTALTNPDEVFGIFHWLNPSGHNMALGSTLPLTEMSIRGVKAAGVWGWNPYNPHVPTVQKFWEPKPPEALRAYPGLYRNCFTFNHTHGFSDAKIRVYIIHMTICPSSFVLTMLMLAKQQTECQENGKESHFSKRLVNRRKKPSHNRPEQAQRVLRSSGSQISWQRHSMVVSCQPYAPAAFIPRDIPGTHFH